MADLFNSFIEYFSISSGEGVTAIGFLVTMIGFLVTIFINLRTLKLSKKNIYINSIAVERMKWINLTREYFAEYNKKLTMIININDTVRRANNSGSNATDDIEKVETLKSEIIYWEDLITLNLNPLEDINKALLKVIVGNKEIISVKDSLSYEQKQELINIQQIILKSEWKRLKLEQKKGRELRSKKINSIIIKVAKKIDRKIYVKYLSSNNFKNMLVKIWITLRKKLNK